MVDDKQVLRIVSINVTFQERIKQRQTKATTMFRT